MLAALVGSLLVAAAAWRRRRSTRVPSCPGFCHSRSSSLGLNDFHGHLEPTTPGSDRDPHRARTCAGGVEYLRDARAGTRLGRTATRFVVGAGDMIGGTPLLSALFHDEPTIEFLNLIGTRLQRRRQPRVRRGHRTSSCACSSAISSAEAAIRWTAARTARRSSGAVRLPRGERQYKGTRNPILPPYAFVNTARRKSAFIGDDSRGHSARSSRRPGSRTRLPRRGRYRERARARAQGVRARRRSSSCSTGRLQNATLLDAASRT